LRALRKAGIDSIFLMCGEIWFQFFGPQTEKARFLNWVRVPMTTAVLVVAERSCRRPESPQCYWDMPGRVDEEQSASRWRSWTQFVPSQATSEDSIAQAWCLPGDAV